MKKIYELIIVGSLFFIFSITSSGSVVQAIEKSDVELYQEGLENGYYDSSFTWEQWKEARSYKAPSLPKNGSSTRNALYKGFTVKKGDIFISDGTSLYGLTGHAAIANGNSYILDAPGYKVNTKKGRLNTTRQSTVKEWLDEYTRKGHVWVYRVPSKYNNVAIDAAQWADRHYYSTTGSSTQNIFPGYFISTNLLSTDPTYCSKIIFQAYYYGSGKLPFVYPTSHYTTIISPYGLISAFQAKYKPNIVKIF